MLDLHQRLSKCPTRSARARREKQRECECGGSFSVAAVPPSRHEGPALTGPCGACMYALSWRLSLFSLAAPFLSAFYDSLVWTSTSLASWGRRREEAHGSLNAGLTLGGIRLFSFYPQS